MKPLRGAVMAALIGFGGGCSDAGCTSEPAPASTPPAAEEVVAAQPELDSLPPVIPLPEALLSEEIPLSSGQTRYVQTRDCGSLLGRAYVLMGFSLIVPSSYGRRECDLEDQSYYAWLAAESEGKVQEGIGVFGSLPPLPDLTVTAQEAAAAIFPEGTAFSERSSGSMEIHGETIPFWESIASLPESETAFQGSYLIRVLRIPHPPTLDAHEQRVTHPGLTLLLAVATEPNALEAAGERLALGTLRVAVHSLRFSLPPEHERAL